MNSAGGSRPLRVGVVGLGFFGRTHLDAWAGVRGAQVVGVCDRNPAAFDLDTGTPQEAFHSDAGTSPPISLARDVTQHTSVDALLRRGLDLLDVVVTEDQHPICVQAALEAGVDVIVEKPLALDFDKATELVQLAERTGRQIYVGQVLRFDPRHIALVELVQGTELRHLSFNRHFQTAAHDVYGRTHPVLNAAVHDIDLAVWLAGHTPELVTAYGSHFLNHEHPDSVDLILEWASGTRAVIQNSWHLAATCPYGFTFDCTIHAAKGTYTIRNEPVLQVWDAQGVTYPELFFWPRFGGARHGALVSELQHFADCATRGKASDRVPLAEVLAVMSTCQAAMESLSTGRPQPCRPVPQIVSTQGQVDG